MKKITNSWHKKLYDKSFASTTLASPSFVKNANQQIDFLLTALDLKAGTHVLDVPCGVGRHSLALAKHGLFVTGIDISDACLKIARTQFKHKRVKYLNGNMLKLKKHKAQYDVVTNLFTSFGYFQTERDNERVLREMYNALKPGGKIALSMMEYDWLNSHFKSPIWTDNGRGHVHIEVTELNKKTKYIITEWTILKRTNATVKVVHHHIHRIRIYRKSELVALMKKVGFKKIQVFDGYNNKPFKKYKTHHPLYLGVK